MQQPTQPTQPATDSQNDDTQNVYSRTACNDLVTEAKAVVLSRVKEGMGAEQKADLLEDAMSELLDVRIMKPALGRVTTSFNGGIDDKTIFTGRWLMGDDPRLPPMPAAPTLMDFFRFRLLRDKMGGNHLLQSARLAMKKGCTDNIVLACLVHDISVVGLIRTDHGHWGAQMIEPYVDPEVTWAVKYHQALRFRADPNYDYDYPAVYRQFFGEDYEPPQYIKEQWAYCEQHPWFDSAMQVVVNDLYAFDPNEVVEIEEFEAVIQRAFRQPAAGLGFDDSPVAHMWRTLIWPNNFL